MFANAQGRLKVPRKRKKKSKKNQVDRTNAAGSGARQRDSTRGKSGHRQDQYPGSVTQRSQKGTSNVQEPDFLENQVRQERSTPTRIEQGTIFQKEKKARTRTVRGRGADRRRVRPGFDASSITSKEREVRAEAEKVGETKNRLKKRPTLARGEQENGRDKSAEKKRKGKRYPWRRLRRDIHPRGPIRFGSPRNREVLKETR